MRHVISVLEDEAVLSNLITKYLRKGYSSATTAGEDAVWGWTSPPTCG
ncbi:MAG: hypothetical protein ACLSUM_00700 [Dysosmobacter welbionis]